MTLHEELGCWPIKNTEAALVFNSGFQANVGIPSTLAGEGDAIVSDSLNHASIIDGCRLSKAKTLVYAHGDLAALEAALKQAAPARRRLIVTAILYGCGEAPLGEIAKSRKY
jgi:7-keto-8-aminopelargonate synthetase-like enzyme